jgi:uncharacterized protein YqjF (DUF2071 family)
VTAIGRRRVAWLAVTVHAGAVALTLAGLLPGLPPGEAAARDAYIAGHRVAWTLGWLAWMAATATWVLFTRAWMDAPPGAGAIGTLALAVTVAGGLADWLADLAWIDGRHERLAFMATGAGSLLYALGGGLLTARARRAPGFPRWLAAWAWLVWAATLGLAAAAFAADGRLVNLASAVLFAAFVPWMLVMGRGWLGAVRPPDSAGQVVRALVPKHPLPMRTLFRQCLLANFAVEPEVMRRLVPPPLEPDLHGGAAWLCVVIAEMERMRPAFLPALLGVTYHQVVYRVVVRHRGERGVYFLRSDANHAAMALAGDWLTFFRFHRSAIEVRREGDLLQVELQALPSHHADIGATVVVSPGARAMAPGSRFGTLAEAQGFLVELYAAFGVDPLTGEVSTVRIERGGWDLRVVESRKARFDFMDGSRLFPAGSARLDSAFYVESIPYRWRTLERR